MKNTSKTFYEAGLCHIRYSLAMVLLGAFIFSPHTAVQASGEPDMKLVANFSEHFETFDTELAKMCLATDRIVKEYANGDSIENSSKAWVDTWESVGVHGVVEVKAPYLYPPVWIGFYGMKGVADKNGSAEEMYAVGESTKAALWQGLGGLRALANATSIETESRHDHEHEDQGQDANYGGIDPDEKPIEAILANLEAAVDAYAHNDAEKASKIVFNTYMEIFEHLEGDLIEADADLVTTIELEFNAGLPLVFKNGGSVADARAKLAEMTKSLNQAKKLLSKIQSDRSSVF